jgi:hypothetical protein
MNTKLLNSRLRKGLFYICELIRLYLSFKPRLKRLFSNRNASWRSRLLKGFRFTHHHITFEEITIKNCPEYDLIVPTTIEELKRLHQSP